MNLTPEEMESIRCIMEKVEIADRGPHGEMYRSDELEAAYRVVERLLERWQNSPHAVRPPA